MITKLFAFAATALMAGVLFAQEPQGVKLTGYLIDNMCASKHVNDKDFGDRVKRHPTSCALEDVCEKTGFAVFADGKLYKFDQAGNSSAKELLKNTKTKKGVQVAVEGTLDGDTLHVTKLEETNSTS